MWTEVSQRIIVYVMTKQMYNKLPNVSTQFLRVVITSMRVLSHPDHLNLGVFSGMQLDFLSCMKKFIWELWIIRRRPNLTPVGHHSYAEEVRPLTIWSAVGFCLSLFLSFLNSMAVFTLLEDDWLRRDTKPVPVVVGRRAWECVCAVCYEEVRPRGVSSAADKSERPLFPSPVGARRGHTGGCIDSSTIRP